MAYGPLLPFPEPDPGPDRWNVLILDNTTHPSADPHLIWHEDDCSTRRMRQLVAGAVERKLYVEVAHAGVR